MKKRLSMILLAVLAFGLIAGAVCAQDTPCAAPPPAPQHSPIATAGSSGTVTFRTDTAPDLDFYQPCNGGDNLIAFDINVNGVDPATASSARLTLAVWDVDFDCDWGGGCERDTVYINGHQVTTPNGFLTGANDQWSTCSFDVPMEYLVEGNNRVEIHIDTLGAGWCVQCDWGELSLNVGPQIEDIDVLQRDSIFGNTYSALQYPVTTKKFYVKPKMKNMNGYEIVKVNWSGDCAPGEGDPYGVTIAAGEHGRKNVTCRVVYKKTGTAQQFTTAPKSKQFNVYFRKDEDDQGRILWWKVPNWFTYWNNDGAVSALADFQYDGSLGGYGMFSSPNTLVVGPATSGTHYGAGYSVDGVVFGGATGIDCAAEVCTHEKYHKWVYDAFWAGMGPHELDTDGDGLPDNYEMAMSHTPVNNPDSHDLEHKKAAGYRSYGDQEWMAMSTAKGATGVAANDWAYPGKKAQNFTVSAPRHVRIAPIKAVKGAGGVGFTGVYTDHGADSNANSLFDYLAVDATINAPAAGDYNIVAWLKDAGNNPVGLINEMVSLNAGAQICSLQFDGNIVHQSGHAGPYSFSGTIYDQEGLQIDNVVNAYTTAAYTIGQFEGSQAYFAAGISDLVRDTDADGDKDQLEITVPIVCTIAGKYEVTGYLTASDGTPVAPMSATADLVAGNQSVTLVASAAVIRKSRISGPYKLMSLGISDGQTQTDFKWDAHTTAAYAYTDFQSGEAEFGPNNTFSDSGLDANSDGTYEGLRITMPVTVTVPGRYGVAGRLFDGDGNPVCEAYSEVDLAAGPQTVNADFDGHTIRLSGKSGPYVLEYAFLYNPQNDLADTMAGVYSTGAYDVNKFEAPAGVTLTGQFDDNSVDADSNGTYEALVCSVGVYASRTSNYAMNARLMDRNGNEIVWASGTFAISAGEFRTLQLTFDGPSIYAHGVSGPYFLRDVYIYDMNDPSASSSIFDAYTTKAAWQIGGNNAPVANAGADETVKANDPAGAILTLDGSASTDADSTPGTNDDIVTFEWLENGAVIAQGETPTVTLAVGVHNITLRVTDEQNLQAEDAVQITVTPSHFVTWGAIDLPVTLPTGPCTVTVTDLRNKSIAKMVNPACAFINSVRVTNSGQQAWLANEMGVVYTWRNGAGAIVLQNTVPMNVAAAAGQTVTVPVRFNAPAIAGAYTLTLSAVTLHGVVQQGALPTDTTTVNAKAAASLKFSATPVPFYYGDGRTVTFLGRVAKSGTDVVLGQWDGSQSNGKWALNGAYRATATYHSSKMSLGFIVYGGRDNEKK